MRNCYWASELPVGDPFGGAAYGEYNDPATGAAVNGGANTLMSAASLGSGIFGKSSASKAAKIQGGAAQSAYDRLSGATRDATGVLGDAYRNSVGQLTPYSQAGGNALNQLEYGLGMDSTYDPNSLGPRKTASDYRNELVAQYTTPGEKNKYGQLKTNAHDTVDEGALQKAIDAKMAEDDQRYAAAAAAAPQFQGQGEKGGLLRNFSQADFQVDPGYQFALDQGQRGIQNSAAAGGSLLSGATLKALTRFNQDTANNQYQNSYNRFNQNQQQQLNTLFNMSGVGQNAAGQIANYGTQMGNTVAGNLIGLGSAGANLQTQAGNAAASGVIGGANAIAQGIGGAINTLGSAASLSQMGGMGNMGRQSSYAPLYGQPGYQNPYSVYSNSSYGFA